MGWRLKILLIIRNLLFSRIRFDVNTKPVGKPGHATFCDSYRLMPPLEYPVAFAADHTLKYSTRTG